MKTKRHGKILQLIRDNNIQTQEELAAMLQESGFTTTQATISRDIKELRLVKVTDDKGGYKYSSVGHDDAINKNAKYQTILRESIFKTDSAKNIVVIKTYAGMAQAAAAAVDYLNLPEIVGSIAGDDTIMLVMRDDDDALELVVRLKRIINN